MFMKNQIRAFILLLLPVFVLSACVSNGVQKESAGNKVKEISTYRGNNSLPPKHRTSTTVKLGRDLSFPQPPSICHPQPLFPSSFLGSVSS